MIRRLILTAVLVACIVPYARAADERANFILTNGERKSGSVVFHGDQHENLINGYLNLGVDNGRDMTFPVAQVAVIDFVGGRPSQTELAKIPESGHAIVLRDGNLQAGHFVNMTGGDTVIWENQSGQRQQYAIRDVSRIYLNPQSARTALNYTGPAAATVGTAGQSMTVLEPGAVRVDANQAWSDAGITVKKGDRVAFRTTGQIQFGQGNGQTAGADGNGNVRQANYPVPVMPVGGLIGKVGNSAPFSIGSNTQPIAMPADGRLMLGVNDNELGDNSGFFSVVVTKAR